jgi:predicted O-methyltransferase YrrM
MYLGKSVKLRKLIGALETANLLALKLAVQRREKLRLYPGVTRRGYMALAGSDTWACRSIFDVFPILLQEERGIELCYTPSPGLEFEPEDLLHLCLVTAAIAPEMVLEIGTFRGRSALNIALNAPKECVVHTFDLPQSGDQRRTMISAANAADGKLIQLSETGIEYKDKPAASKIVQHFADSLQYDFSRFHGCADLVFVDGAHHYEAARSDTENALKICKDGGYIVWDDWGNYGDYAEIMVAVGEILPLKEVVQLAGTQLAIYRKP